MKGPSPLPFRLNENGTTIYAANQDTVAVCSVTGMVRSAMAFPDDTTQRENAAMLVLRANACDDLVRALEACEGFNGLHNGTTQQNELLAIIRTALAKVKP